MQPRFSHIVFDLDGTLVDSLPGIEASAEFAIRKCLPDRTLPPMRPLIGPPIAEMFAAAFPDLDSVGQAELLSAFRDHYDTVGCLLSEAYPGVAGTLEKLHSLGVKMFVLTNKPRRAAGIILAHLTLSRYFAQVICPDSATPPFRSKTAGAEYLRDAFTLPPAQTAVVGDGADDLAAARACGFSFVAAAYGYGTAATQENGTPVVAVKYFSHILPLML